MHVRPHLEYGDVIFHERSADLMKLLESVQYQAGLIVLGCWQSTSTIKLYKELGWESLSERRKFHQLNLYYKILKNKAPEYLSSYVLTSSPLGTQRYLNSFFPYCYNNWNRLATSLQNSLSLSIFKSNYLKTIRPPKNIFWGIEDHQGLRFLTRLCVQFSDLRDHRFNHSFNCVNPICKYNLEPKSIEHFLLSCPRYSLQCITLLSNITTAINTEILNLPDDHLSNILLYGSPLFNVVSNKTIILTTIYFIKVTGRFNKIEAYSQ